MNNPFASRLFILIKNRKIILFYLIITVYISVTINSNGFHHPDEHFQLIEFAGFKAGWNTGYDLAWEYDYHIRPTLQPYIALIIFKTFNFFKIDNPYTLALILRGLTALFSIFVISFFIQSNKLTLERRSYLYFVLLSFLLWFLPSINVRFSSETWAGLSLLLSVGVIQRNKSSKSYFFLIGILLGLSFEFRFQIGLCIVGILLWLLIVKKTHYFNWFITISGLLVVIISCAVLDSFYYNSVVFTPYNYLKINVIDKVSSLFGTEPWYYYLRIISEAPSLLIGYMIIFSIFFLLITDYKNIILWCIFPYLIVHSIIPHKEPRFLFPLVNFIPILLVWTYESVSKYRNLKIHFILNILIVAAIIINIGGLFIIFKPAGNGNVNLANYIHKSYSKNEPIEVYSSYLGPYSVGNAKGLIANFYTNNEIELYFIDDDFIFTLPDNKLIVVPKGFFRDRQLLTEAGYKIQKESIPNWMSFFNKLYRVYNENSVLLLYTQESVDANIP
ncbi:mannosyltransferase [Petrimonas sp.]|uniref:mannosyltransferase n=1 Tax=Petrimonas sp. TaxID=2023866 RepID=UPI003F50F3EB